MPNITSKRAVADTPPTAEEAAFYLSLMRAYLDSAHDGIFVLCDELKFHVANRMLESWLGESESSLTAHNRRIPITEFLGSEASRTEFETHFRAALAGKPTRFECFIHPPRGKPRWVDISMNRVDVEDGDLVVGVVRDVTEHKTTLLRMEHRAQHDELTGLVNRREFMRRLDNLVRAAAVEQRQHALLCLDLDQFKVINDTCGHAAGDELLRQVATLLRLNARATDTIGRLGGDEFAVMLTDCSASSALNVAEAVRQALSTHRFSWEERVFEVAGSIGVAAIDAASHDAKTVLSLADAACYVAKDNGRNRVQLYSGGSECVQKRAEMDWVSRITRALDEERFCLYYQSVAPIGAHGGAHREILLRMVDGGGNCIAPGQFLPSAEKYNLMAAIDRWVIRTVFATQAREWDALVQQCAIGAGPCDTFTAINLSGVSLNDDSFPDFLREQVAMHKVAPAAVCFEITETVAVHNLKRVASFIAEMKEMGFRFALDDFGAGMSSFSYLKALPVDFIKIDGALVREITRSPLDSRIVESIAYVAQGMGVKTIAEFVENEEILERLRAIGIDYAQGYGIHVPEPVA
jgi:diguanylate cyclase (GGDEF)-like protein/PAS domain S-box-containing protein